MATESMSVEPPDRQLRIALLLNRDIESCLALNLLRPLLGDRLVAVFLSERVGSTAVGRARALSQLSFVEQTLFNRLVFPLADSRSAIEDRLVGFEEFARRFSLPVQSLQSARSPEGLEALRAAGADLFVSIRFGHILGDAAIAIPPRGVLNLHSGLLPAYRGILASFRALVAGDTHVGCTLHWIDSPAIDRGGIIATARQPVDRSRSLLWHILSLYPLGIRLIEDAVRRIERAEEIVTTPQDAGSGAYFSYPTEDELLRFSAQGWRLFDPEDVEKLSALFGVV